MNKLKILETFFVLALRGQVASLASSVTC